MKSKELLKDIEYQLRRIRLNLDSFAHRAKKQRKKNLYQKASRDVHDAICMLKAAKRIVAGDRP